MTSDPTDQPRLPRQLRPTDSTNVAINVEVALYDEAHRIAELREETVDQVVARALKRYALGRKSLRG